MPLLSFALRLADNVGHEGTIGRCEGLLKLRPTQHVLEVKVHVVGFSEFIEVDEVDAKEVAWAKSAG